MSPDLHQSFLLHLGKFRQFDLPEMIANSNEPSPWGVDRRIGPFLPNEFVALSKQFFNTLERLLTNNELWPCISTTAAHHYQFGDVDGLGQTSNYVNHVERGLWEPAVGNLQRMVHWALANGIWRDAALMEPLNEEDVRSLTERVNTTSKLLSRQLSTVSSMVEEVDQARSALTKFTDDKRAELKAIADALEEARNSLAEINKLVSEARVLGTVGSDINAKLGELLGSADVQMKVLERAFEEFKKDADSQKEEVNSNATQTKTFLAQAEAKYEEILGHKTTIERLVGMAADGYLGNKFEARAEQIHKGLRFWQGAVPVSVVVAVIWVIVVFTCLNTKMGNEWVNLGINLLKTSPAFILMGFAFRQYGKERNLQEEYSFKAAVAMTINAYADLLAAKDNPENLTRQRAIMNALKQVHFPPKLYDESGGTLFSVKAKEIRETLGTMNDTLKELTGK